VVRRGLGSLRRLAVPALLSVITVLVLIVGVFPTRIYLEKRADVDATEASLARLQADNDATEARVAALDSDAEIERVARQEFGLARPGEETYVVLPPPAEPLRVPEGWPFSKLHLRLERH
jgi:cell division protein FtsB